MRVRVFTILSLNPLPLPQRTTMNTKRPKNLPKLPLSVFTPPNSGTSDRFPLPPSPSVVHPSTITDAQPFHLTSWKGRKDGDDVGEYGAKSSGIVLVVDGVDEWDA